jgi:hypothetical protein
VKKGVNNLSAPITAGGEDGKTVVKVDPGLTFGGAPSTITFNVCVMFVKSGSA